MNDQPPGHNRPPEMPTPAKPRADLGAADMPTLIQAFSEALAANHMPEMLRITGIMDHNTSGANLWATVSLSAWCGGTTELARHQANKAELAWRLLLLCLAEEWQADWAELVDRATRRALDSWAPSVAGKPDKCTCHERDSSSVCKSCHAEGYFGHMEEDQGHV